MNARSGLFTQDSETFLFIQCIFYTHIAPGTGPNAANTKMSKAVSALTELWV